MFLSSLICYTITGFFCLLSYELLKCIYVPIKDTFHDIVYHTVRSMYNIIIIIKLS